MIGKPVTLIEEKLAEYMGPMAKFVVHKQLKDSGSDANPSKENLYKMVNLIEARCLHNIMLPEEVKDTVRYMRKLIDTTPVESIEEKKEPVNIDMKIVDYLSRVFGEIAESIVNIQKKNVGIANTPTVDDYYKLAEQIKSISADMADEDIAKMIYTGIVSIIEEYRRE